MCHSSSFGPFRPDDFEDDFSSRTCAKKVVPRPNGFATAGAIAGECQTIQGLALAVSCSAEPEEQNDVAKAYASNTSDRSSTRRSM